MVLDFPIMDTAANGTLTEEAESEIQSSVPVDELAFEYWAFTAGQNSVTVSKMLANEGHDVSPRLIRYWASRGKWAERAKDKVRELFPAATEQTVTELVFGSLESSRYLRSVVTDDTVQAKVRVTAAIALMDRAGYSPVGRNDRTQSQIAGDRRGVYVWHTEDDIKALIAEIHGQPV